VILNENSNIIKNIENKYKVQPSKILILNKNENNINLLKELLEDDYEVIIPKCKEDLLSQSYDLIIADEYSFKKYESELNKIKKKEKPIFLAVLLLVTNNRNMSSHEKLKTIADDLVKIPVNKIILKTRVENLLRIRKQSLRAEYRYYYLAEKASAGICILNSKEIVYANPAFIKICGKENVKVSSNSFLELVHPEDREKIRISLNKSESQNQEVRLLVNEENIKWVNFKTNEIDYKDSKSQLIFVLDVTEQKKSKEQIKYLTYYDNLTGLYNRDYFEVEVKRLNTERQLPLSVIMGDVNDLKLVNDAFGHHKGDNFLKEIANTITSSCRDEDIIARWGGDEFIILLPRTSRNEAEKIIKRIKISCREADENPIKLSIALGSATKNFIEESFDNTINKAEDRMYKNKIVENQSNSIITTLGNTLREKSFETKEHTERLQKLAKKFAKKINLSASDMDNLKLITKLHDIGKVAIPERILKKPSKLSDEEWEIIKGHSESGYRIVKSIPKFASIADAVLSHHERWDGKGYPRGLKGEDIPFLARIISIIDAYDVMIHDRPYKRSVSKEEALEEIKRCAGNQFDPGLAAEFIKIIKKPK